MCFWMLLILPLTAVTGPLGEAKTERERNPSEDLTPARAQSGQSPPKCFLLEIPVWHFYQSQTRRLFGLTGGPTRCKLSSLRHLSEDMPCAEGVDHPPDALGDVLLALKNIWNGKHRKPTKRELCRFGFCSDSHDEPWFSSLITKMVQEENSLEYVNSRKVHWHVEEDGGFTVTFDSANPGSCSQQTASTMLLFFIDSCNTDEFKIQFSGRVLQPNNQVHYHHTFI